MSTSEILVCTLVLSEAALALALVLETKLLLKLIMLTRLLGGGPMAKKILALPAFMCCVCYMIDGIRADPEALVLLGCSILLPFVIVRLHHNLNEINLLKERAMEIEWEHTVSSIQVLADYNILKLRTQQIWSEITS